MSDRKSIFTTDESLRLLDQLAKPEVKIWILHKGRETRVTEKRDEAWASVTAAFNSCGQVPRSTEQLKKKWDNLITKAKKEQDRESTGRQLAVARSRPKRRSCQWSVAEC